MHNLVLSDLLAIIHVCVCVHEASLKEQVVFPTLPSVASRGVARAWNEGGEARPELRGNGGATAYPISRAECLASGFECVLKVAKVRRGR